jgi:hypothetical protein
MTETPQDATQRMEPVETDQDSEPTSTAPEDARPQRQHSGDQAEGDGDADLSEGERRDAIDVD